MDMQAQILSLFKILKLFHDRFFSIHFDFDKYCIKIVFSCVLSFFLASPNILSGELPQWLSGKKSVMKKFQNFK